MVLIPIMQHSVNDVYKMSPFPPLFEAPLEMCVRITGMHLQGTDVATHQKIYKRKNK